MTRLRRCALALVALAAAPGARAGLPASPVVQWTWDGQVRSGGSPSPVAAVLLRLEDDNGDGRIDAGDPADVAFVSESGFAPLTLHGLDGATGAALFTRDVSGDLLGYAHPAAADLTGDGVAEIVAVTTDGRLVVYDRTGARIASWPADCPGTASPTIADLDHDGIAEVACLWSVTDAAGALRWTGGASDGVYYPFASLADVDPAAPGLEVISGSRLFDARGNLLWSSGLPSGNSAVGDLDFDGLPEIVQAAGDLLFVLKASGGLAAPVVNLGARYESAGTPMLADVTGDGSPEIFVAMDSALDCWELSAGALRRRWQAATQNVGLGAQVSAHDFDGDGIHEILYHDNDEWFILDGSSGTRLWTSPPFRAQTTFEAVIVANLDTDPAAEILTVGATCCSRFEPNFVIAYEVPRSTTPRGTWNQAGYHPCSIEEVGTVPVVEPPPWETHGTWGAQGGADACRPACRTRVVAPVADAVACAGEVVVLDASGLDIIGCEAPLEHEWRAGPDVVGNSPFIAVSPDATTDYQVQVTCRALPSCSVSDVARVEVQRPPSQPAATVRDLSECGVGVVVEWTAAEFEGGAGVYNVYRSENPADPTCGDALGRAPIAVGLTSLSWLDTSATVGAPHAWVVEAEDSRAPAACLPAGPFAGGAVSRACAGTASDVSDFPFPADAGPVLRLRHEGDRVEILWPSARPLVAGEHFHLRKALARPSGPFDMVLAHGLSSLLHAEIDTSSRLQCFDLRVANPCEDESRD